MSALLLLRAVAAAGLLTVADTLGVQRTTNDLVPDAGQVTDPPATHQHDRVLLQVVADTRDVGGDLKAAHEPDTGHLAQGRVGLTRGSGVHARAHATTLRAALERRRLALARLGLAALADQLLDGGHRVSPLPSAPCTCTDSVVNRFRLVVPPLLGPRRCRRFAHQWRVRVAHPDPQTIRSGGKWPAHRPPRSGVSPAETG